MPPPQARSRDLALIGVGPWGKNLARCFERHGALRAVVDPGVDAAALRSAYPDVAITANLGDVLADEAVRKIAIATPSASHFEIACAALRAGKDVFVEKPVCLRAHDAQALAVLAQQTGRVLMVGHLLQYHPCVVKLHELVAKGSLGRLLSITSNRLNLGRFRRDENALYSFAPHDVSLVLSLMGDKLPLSVRCVGAAFLREGVADATTTLLKFDGGVLAQLCVSWLNPFKEQKLTIVGTTGMAVFDDTKPWTEKLLVYRDYIAWADGGSQATAPRGEPQLVDEEEPLMAECRHFLSASDERFQPRTDGFEGVRVMQVLDMAQRSLESDGERVDCPTASHSSQFAHPSAAIDDGAHVGEGSKIWHFSHVMSGARIGRRCTLGQNVFVAGSVCVHDDVKVQNNVSLYDGVELEDAVFIGPSVVFTNVKRPRAELSRNGSYDKTLVRHGATLGANATIVCGTTLGRYCFIAAGAVVTHDVPDYALMVGNPARQNGWVGRRGQRLRELGDGAFSCPESGETYRELQPGRLERLDEG